MNPTPSKTAPKGKTAAASLSRSTVTPTRAAPIPTALSMKRASPSRPAAKPVESMQPTKTEVPALARTKAEAAGEKAVKGGKHK